MAKLPTNCPSGSRYKLQHYMSFKKGGSSIRHISLKDIVIKMLFAVCNHADIEPKLKPLMGKELNNRTSNSTNKGRLDIRGREV